MNAQQIADLKTLFLAGRVVNLVQQSISPGAYVSGQVQGAVDQSNGKTHLYLASGMILDAEYVAWDCIEVTGGKPIDRPMPERSDLEYSPRWQRIKIVKQFFNTSGSHTIKEILAKTREAFDKAQQYAKANVSETARIQTPATVYQTVTSWVNPLHAESIFSEDRRCNLGLECNLWLVEASGFRHYELVSIIWMDTGH